MLVFVSLLAAAFVCWLHEHGIHPSKPVIKFLHRPLGEVLIVLVCIGAFVHHGATKGFLGSPRMMASREMQTELVSEPETSVPVAGMFSTYTNAVTNVCATGIKPAETSVFLRAHWPSNLYPAPTGIEVYATPQLSTNAWVGVGTATVNGGGNSTVIELPYSLLPDGWASSMFFMFGLNIDTDGDGLSDAFERIVTKTDPNLADTDGDGMPDGWEYSNGLNPLSDSADDEANADADGDGLANKDEFLFNTNPHEPDTDQDGLSDIEEIGYVEELRGGDFLWLDTTGLTNLLGNSSGIDSHRSKMAIPWGVEVNGVCYTNAQIDLDGLVTLINPANQTGSIGSGYRHSGGVSNYLWSACHLTIAAYNADLYAKPRLEDWQSVFSSGMVATNGTEYAVVEYRNVGHYDFRSRDDSPVMTLQVILPRDETNTVYVSYRSVPELISSLNEIQTFGVQMPMTNCVPGRGTYANLPWSKRDNCFDAPLTLKYHLPTGTLPNSADWDKDGLNDAIEIFVLHTDPFRGDTDGDGLDDGVEIAYGTDPLLADTDGDSMPDGWEINNGLNPILKDGNLDLDGDGLPNKWEYYNETDPQNTDSDGDSLDDRAEAVWLEDFNVNVPWFTVDPLMSFCPDQNVDSRLCFCDLPCSCRLAGRQFSIVAADVNGVVYFADPSTTNSIGTSNSGVDLSTSRNKSYATIAAYWTDLCMRPSLNSAITFGVGLDGTNRYFVVQYDHVGFWNGPLNEVSFQVSFSESNPGVVYVRYGTVIDARGDSYTVSMGCQGAKETGFDARPCLSYYFQKPPPQIFAGTTIAYHFGTGGDPLLQDTDGDDLGDAEEEIAGSNPRKVDTDGDGFSDREEVEYGMNPCSAAGVDGAEGDLDGDGLNNGDEHIAGTNPALVDTDGDGLSDLEEVGSVSTDSDCEWIIFDENDGIDITGAFPDPDSSVVNYRLRNDMRVQGECVTNVIVDVNGVLYFPRCGHGADIRSSGSRSLDYSIYPNALVVAPYWRDLYLTTNAPATKVSVFETGVGTNGLFVLQYENACPYSNLNRTSVTNAISFQVIVERGGAGSVHIVYKDLIGSSMKGQSASVGFQSLGGLWSYKLSYGQMMTTSNGGEGPTVFNTYGQLFNGFCFNFFPGFGTDPLVVDTDGDGLSDGQEAGSGTGPMAPDSDGDGMLDGWEQSHGLDPADPNGDNGADGDPDSDGVSNLEEAENNTDPRNPDTDGDGIADGIELDQGTDPTDLADAVPVQWVAVDGDLGEGVPKSESATFSIPAGRTALVCVFVASEEYPSWTGQDSEFNDVLYWNIHADGNETLSNTVRVNNEDGAWNDAEDFLQGAYGYYPVVLKDLAFYTAGATALSVSVTIRAMNISDDRLPSSVIVGMFPLNVVQANTPTATGAAETTDAESSYVRSCIPTNGIAYITGQPAAPQLTAQIKGLPDWIDVAWSMTLTSERSNRRFDGIDDRILQPVDRWGDAVYDIASELHNEIVGGSCLLNIRVNDNVTMIYPFAIRGKNPLDATARAYVTDNVDADFSSYAWKIVKHETLDGHRVYNQFNASQNQYKELPNWGTPHGWGIAQVDKGRNGDTTAEVYNWHTNIAAMNVILREKRADAIRFLGYYSSAYSNLPNWSDPPSTNINGQIITAEMWSTITLYNGAQGIPGQKTPTHQRDFSSPLQFDPQTGRWIFHQNTRNPNYVRDVMNGSTESEVE